MATIKEVASLAQVSIGTVSNVLNGKTNNAELIERVEDAMQQLGYRPDANARSLKNTKTNVIGVVLPNIINPDLSAFLSTIEIELREKGYSLLLKITQNNELLEKNAVNKCLEQCVDGIILYSASQRKFYENSIRDSVPVIFINQHSASDQVVDLIHIDYEEAFEKALQGFCAHEIDEVGLILESNLIGREKLMEIYHKYYANGNNIKLINYSKESGFKGAYELLCQNPGIKAIIAGNYLISEGVKKAIKLLGCKGISIVAFKEQNWIEDDSVYAAQISIPLKRIAQSAVKRLLYAIENPHTHDKITETFAASYEEIHPLLSKVQKNSGKGKTLHLLMFESPAAHSISQLSKVYMEKTNSNIQFEIVSYEHLEHALYKAAAEKNHKIDGFMMDILWLDSLYNTGILEPLNGLVAQPYLESFLEGKVKEYGEKSGQLYGIPFMSGTQLLFYQKDLFEDQKLKMSFYRMYGEILQPPTTWAQFNLIAEFFTRSYNKKSPVKYGVSCVQGENVYTTISFLNRLWAYGSDIFSPTGEIVINTSNAVAAMKSFIKSYQFTSESRVNSTWDDVVAEFKSGDSAMVILYDSHAVAINDYTQSKIAGNIGYSLIPGGCPVLGGWNIGINHYSTHKREMVDFLLWACGDEIAIPISLLGGTTLRKKYYMKNDLENMHPWKSLAMESYPLSRKRLLPQTLANKPELYIYTIPHEICRILTGEINEEQALENIERELKKLLTTP